MALGDEHDVVDVLGGQRVAQCGRLGVVTPRDADGFEVMTAGLCALPECREPRP